MNQKYISSFLLGLMATFQVVSSDPDRAQRLADHAVHIEQIKAKRAHCALLIDMRHRLEKEMDILEKQTAKHAFSLGKTSEYDKVTDQLDRQAWQYFRFWYSAHLDREKLFLNCRNSGADLDLLYNQLRSSEQFLSHTLSLVEPLNRLVADAYQRKMDRLAACDHVE